MCIRLCVVPFDEDERDRSVWFLDHDYLENMAAMFKKVNCKFILDYAIAKNLKQSCVCVVVFSCFFFIFHLRKYCHEDRMRNNLMY